MSEERARLLELIQGLLEKSGQRELDVVWRILRGMVG